MTIETVSATNMRVNLTDYIADLSADKRIAITKHGKIIAYVVSPQDPAFTTAQESDTVAQPEPMAEAEPEPMAEAQPEPMAEAEADFIVENGTDSIDLRFESFLTELEEESENDLDNVIAL